MELEQMANRQLIIKSINQWRTTTLVCLSSTIIERPCSARKPIRYWSNKLPHGRVQVLREVQWPIPGACQWHVT